MPMTALWSRSTPPFSKKKLIKKESTCMKNQNYKKGKLMQINDTERLVHKVMLTVKMVSLVTGKEDIERLWLPTISMPLNI